MIAKLAVALAAAVVAASTGGVAQSQTASITATTGCLFVPGAMNETVSNPSSHTVTLEVTAPPEDYYRASLSSGQAAQWGAPGAGSYTFVVTSDDGAIVSFSLDLSPGAACLTVVQAVG